MCQNTKGDFVSEPTPCSRRAPFSLRIGTRFDQSQRALLSGCLEERMNTPFWDYVIGLCWRRTSCRYVRASVFNTRLIIYPIWVRGHPVCLRGGEEKKSWYGGTKCCIVRVSHMTCVCFRRRANPLPPVSVIASHFVFLTRKIGHFFRVVVVLRVNEGRFAEKSSGGS